MTDDALALRSRSVVYRDAVISPDGLYRYRLDRWWGLGPRVVWIMLNPSTADADKDDPTLTRCINFTRDWGYDGCTIVNLYPYRTPYPADLRRWIGTPDSDRVMAINAAYVATAIVGAALVIAAWGHHAPRGYSDTPNPEWHHIGLTVDGAPRHPLMVRKGAQPIRWTLDTA